MTVLRILVEDGDVADFITKHNLEHEVQVLQEVVYLPGETQGGSPQVLMIGTIDGKKRVLKTTLRLFLTAGSALNGAAERDQGPNWRGP